MTREESAIVWTVIGALALSGLFIMFLIARMGIEFPHGAVM